MIYRPEGESPLELLARLPDLRNRNPRDLIILTVGELVDLLDAFREARIAMEQASGFPRTLKRLREAVADFSRRSS